MIKTCLVCGTEFHLTSKHWGQKLCSPKCGGIFRRRKEDRICRWCKKKFTVRPSSSRRFCCKSHFSMSQKGVKRPQTARALLGHPCSEERKKRISDASTHVATKNELECVHSIWRTGFLRDWPLVTRLAAVSWGKKLYYRELAKFKQENPGMCWFTLSRDAPKSSIQQVIDFAADVKKQLETQPSITVAKRHHWDEKTLRRWLKHLRLPWQRYFPPESQTRIERCVKLWLEQHGTQPQAQFCISVGTVRRYYDFRVGQTLIEVQGDYWHCNPRVYATPITDVQVRNQKRDKIKKTAALNRDFSLIYVWESDLYKYPTRVLTALLEEIRRTDAHFNGRVI